MPYSDRGYMYDIVKRGYVRDVVNRGYMYHLIKGATCAIYTI